MSIFKRKAKPEKLEYDHEKYEPVLRCSICNGEMVAGLKDRKTGKFEEIGLVRTDAEVEDFRIRCGVETLRKIY